MDGVFWLGASHWVRQHAQLQLLPLRVSSIPLSQHQQLHHHQQQQQRTAPWSAAQHFYIPASCTMSWGITPQGCSHSATPRSAAAPAPSSAAAPHRAALAASSSPSTAPLRAAPRRRHHPLQHHCMQHCGASSTVWRTTSCGTTSQGLVASMPPRVAPVASTPLRVEPLNVSTIFRQWCVQRFHHTLTLMHSTFAQVEAHHAPGQHIPCNVACTS